MSQAQYNLKTPTNYLQRKMFLDPAGPVTIQRFEEVKCNKIVKFEQEARGFFWVPEEVSLTKDSGIAGLIFLVKQHTGRELSKDHAGLQALHAELVAEFDAGRQTAVEWEELAERVTGLL